MLRLETKLFLFCFRFGRSRKLTWTWHTMWSSRSSSTTVPGLSPANSQDGMLVIRINLLSLLWCRFRKSFAVMLLFYVYCTSTSMEIYLSVIFFLAPSELYSRVGWMWPFLVSTYSSSSLHGLIVGVPTSCFPDEINYHILICCPGYTISPSDKYKILYIHSCDVFIDVNDKVHHNKFQFVQFLTFWQGACFGFH